MTLLTTASPLRPPWLERISARQWVYLDYAVALLFSAGALVHLLFFPRFPADAALGFPRWLLAPLYLLAAAPIAFRRRWPVATLSITCAAVTVTTLLGHSLAPAPLIALPLYSVTVNSARGRSVLTLVVVESALLLALAIAWALGRAQGDVTFNFFLAAATWFIADSIRTRRTYVRGLAAQREERQRLEIEEARRALVEERMSIARDLHDVVAHSLSVIAIQSGVGRHVLDTQPDEARKALAAVEATSRSALEELRGVLGVLRRADDDAAATAPAPRLRDLDGLFDRVRAAGVPVVSRVSGDVRPLTAAMELSLYRITQEALTNVVKHARSAPTTIDLEYGVDEVVLTVRNDAPPPIVGAGEFDHVTANGVSPKDVSPNGVSPGRAAPGRAAPGRAASGRTSSTEVLADDTVELAASPRRSSPVESRRVASGHGIVGMTERARSCGGTLQTRQLEDGGFFVCARLRAGEVA